MLETKVFASDGSISRTFKIPKSIFDVKWNSDMVNQVVLSMESNLRAGTAHTKNRAEVSGTGKKPWKQKGTGRARHGSRRSPIWVGGGIAHGPRTDKDYSKTITKSMRRGALVSLLSQKFRNGEIIFIEPLDIKTPKTKDGLAILKNISKAVDAPRLANGRKPYAVLALPAKNKTLQKSFNNLPSVTVEMVQNISVLDIINHKYCLFINPEEALEFLKVKNTKKV
ncbi:50S ribosomal protein L4 [Candidatus Nomurabacteria bacterium RIFCSPHIGHO2_02_FULL_33_12]|uniref:Large ribosomal subunit protein uL4 n=1 Tax=Candidatus Nomurabacteria bacterium RIFCSPLOWO2_01_FULL_33_17 TaxID=1801764 RepID=A0A1F6WQ82_9BACT|nr:MAG: 50S ribosomal protein L4 [Candidatus Nomurabacteria bacterium RIFCSPHIGHO2_02_FULL_33_12]OGI84017.1 MAG: 50S ribosomal protein L4 [Candidatus Nomurabacteria bacterium RIFCSPLOWO2_01_FULL_33_17]